MNGITFVFCGENARDIVAFDGLRYVLNNLVVVVYMYDLMRENTNYILYNTEIGLKIRCCVMKKV